MWWLYETALLIGLCCYVPRAVWRRRLPHRGWTMRFGRYPEAVRQALAGRPTIWVHAVSLGEVLAIQPLLRALAERNPRTPLVLSTVTPAGFEAAATQIVGRGVAVYLPLDLRGCVRRAFNTFQPRALLLVEAELWPTLLREARARRVPVAVINGRMSARAFRRYRWVRPVARRLFGQVDRFLMQGPQDAQRVIELGVPAERVQALGSLKWDASLGARPSPETIRATAARLGLNSHDAVIVAGSTHRGEEPLLLEAFRALRVAHPRARLIVAPRHLERLDEIERLIRAQGWRVARLSAPSATTWDVGLVDTFGQLPQYYGVATLAVIGGSFIPHGGQNPLEAASLAKPILFGPSTHNFADITQQLLAHDAARQLATREELSRALQELLADPAAAEAMGRRAQVLTQRTQGVTVRSLEALAPLLSW